MSNGKSFIISREFPIDRARMYALWTEVASLSKWFGPAGVTISKSSLELRPSGRYHFCMRTPEGGETWGLWVFTTINDGRMLQWRHSFSNAAGDITRHPMSETWPRVLLSTVKFEDVEGAPGRTRVRLEWAPYEPTDVERATFESGFESMLRGWSGTFDQLDAYIAGLTTRAAGSKISPCLWFDANGEDAARFYTSLFADGAILTTGYYPEGMPGPAGSVMLVEFTIAGQSFQALNGGPHFKPNPSISFFVQLTDADDAKRHFDALSSHGQVLMPLGAYAWSPCYAWVQDRFGVSWQIMVGDHAKRTASIVPCLMFAGPQHGRAEDAMNTYASIFPGGRIERIERYAAGEGPTGTVKHGRFALGGQEFVAMDSHISHDVTFTEGVSLSVRCTDQAEVDLLWRQLTEGGAPGQCGWLKDRFGVSWQIVPEALVSLQSRGDSEANTRMFRAMLGMKRLDIAALERAFRGA